MKNAARQMDYARELLCIDPGRHVGYAFFTEISKSEPTPPRSSGVRHIERDKDPDHELTSSDTGLVGLLEWFEGTLYRFQPDLVYVEGWNFYANSGKSHAAAFGGELAWLSLLIGGFVAQCQQQRIDWAIIDPRWQGQLTDHAMKEHIKCILKNKQKYKTHEADAVGLGLWAVGLI